MFLGGIITETTLEKDVQQNEIQEKKKKGISAGTLKIIAVITMFIDHFAASTMQDNPQVWDFTFIFNTFLYSENPVSMLYIILRSIGRIAFPIFCFLIVEGFFHTKNVKKYALRLLIFAFISEIPFDLALMNQHIEPGKLFELSYQNVYFTLFIGLLVIWAMNKSNNNVFISILAFFIGSFAAFFIRSDYGYMGIIPIVMFYLAHDSKIKTAFANIFGFAFEFQHWGAAYLSIPLIHFYNGERGKIYNGKFGVFLKYFFYAFYPVHLFLIYLIPRLL